MDSYISFGPVLRRVLREFKSLDRLRAGVVSGLGPERRFNIPKMMVIPARYGCGTRTAKLFFLAGFCGRQSRFGDAFASSNRRTDLRKPVHAAFDQNPTRVKPRRAISFQRYKMNRKFCGAKTGFVGPWHRFPGRP